MSPDSDENDFETVEAPRSKETDSIPGEDRPSSPMDVTRPLEAEPSTAISDGSRLLGGMRLGDFQIIERLGRGSFATVYLALQVSLGRQVALKVAKKKDDEARALAVLEHQHVVRVFSEDTDSESGLYLICMQFVPGIDLDRLLREMDRHPMSHWSGKLILEVLDRVCRHPATFDPAALRDREHLGRCDLIEAICWLGARLAEGLSHAHAQGILHQDIKPANILLNRYGRPLLSDFNIARAMSEGSTPDSVGGTMRYMAPEHLEAFNPRSPVTASSVDERSDIYSLGLVLFEMLTGRKSLDATLPICPRSEVLEKLVEQRRTTVPWIRDKNERAPAFVDRVVRRCLQPDRKDRYQNAEELLKVLEGCQQLQQIHRSMPRPHWLTRLCSCYPGWMVVILIFTPHLLGSIVNITYNSLRIVGNLNEAQQQSFVQIVMAYNLVVYPIGLWIAFRLFTPLIRGLRAVQGYQPVDSVGIWSLRRQALKIPNWVIVLSCLGWLPGGVLFPLGISLWSTAVSGEVLWHFIISFTISGLIATTYSYFAIEFLLLRIFYPSLWVDPLAPREQARKELQPIEGRVRTFQTLAGLIPLIGAILLLSAEDQGQFTLTFRLLVIGLIGLGMIGLGLTLMVGTRLNRTLNALIGARSG